jgi:hypothetical protein
MVSILKSRSKPNNIQGETVGLRRRSQGVVILLLILAGAIFLWVGLIVDDDTSLQDVAGNAVQKANSDHLTTDDVVNVEGGSGGGAGNVDSSSSAGSKNSGGDSSTASSPFLSE